VGRFDTFNVPQIVEEPKRVKLKSFRSAICLGGVIALLVGCGASRALPSAGGVPADSWMLREAASGELLYVSDLDAYQVDVFSFPTGKNVGVLHGFKAPEGLCVDQRGDVYVLDNRAHDILEYPHGGDRPIRTIKEPRQEVLACSIDPLTGDLAVASNPVESDGPGVIAIYRKANGTPHYYIDRAMAPVTFCSYDNKGNLFIDGWTKKTGKVIFHELPKGGSAFTKVWLNHYIEGPGGIQRSGNNMVIGDIDRGIVFEFAVSGNAGKLVKSTPLYGAVNTFGFALQGDLIISETVNTYRGVDFWNYPKGRKPIKTILGFDWPVGIALSPSR
jgi:hypothetical protein